MVYIASRVEQDVYRADLLGRCIDRPGVAHIENVHLGNAIITQSLEPGHVDVGGDHPGAFARKRDGRGTADAGARCGAECGLACQASGHEHLPVFVPAGAVRLDASLPDPPALASRKRLTFLSRTSRCRMTVLDSRPRRSFRPSSIVEGRRGPAPHCRGSEFAVGPVQWPDHGMEHLQPARRPRHMAAGGSRDLQVTSASMHR